MPQIPTTPGTDNKKAPAPAAKPPLIPPEEEFWKHYSPHHEFSLSSAASFTLHVVIIGGVLLIGYLLLKNLDTATELPQLDAVAVEGGIGDSEGDPRGGGGGGGTGGQDIGNPKEAVSQDRPKVQNDVGGGKDVLEEPKEVQVDVASNPNATRTLSQGEVPRELDNLGRRAYTVLAKATGGTGSRGTGGGEGGGRGTGTGTGTGGGVGEGPPGEVEAKRAARQVRWRVIFNSTADGVDYRDKLKAMEALLVIAQYKQGSVNAQGQAALTYPFIIKPEDISDHARLTPASRDEIERIHRIFWIDDKPQSVQSLARALGLSSPPPLIAVFFPKKVELKLRALEKKRYGGLESKIRETKFHVVLTPNQEPGYRLICDQVILTNGRTH